MNYLYRSIGFAKKRNEKKCHIQGFRNNKMFMNKHTKGDKNLCNENFLTLKKLRKELDD